MARHGERLTDAMLTKLSVPAKGAVIHTDQTLTGFGVRVTKGGVRTFVLTYGRERRRLSIGRVGVISLADARKEAKRYLASETLGKRSTRSIRWEAGVKEYLAEVERKRKSITYKGYKDFLGRFSFPGLLTEIHPQDITRKLERLSKYPTTEHHAFATLRQFFNWAYRKNYIDVSPMARMQQSKAPKSRDRVLTDEELGKIWKACGEDNFGRLVKVLILTGQRRGEICKLTPADISEGRARLQETKNGKPHVFPASPVVLRLVQGGVVWGGFSKSKAELDERSGVSGWVLHDLRRSFASGLAAQGTSVVVTEKLLNHTSGSLRGVAGIYNRFEYWNEMKAAMEAWEKKVLTFTQEAPLAQATA